MKTNTSTFLIKYKSNGTTYSEKIKAISLSRAINILELECRISNIDFRFMEGTRI